MSAAERLRVLLVKPSKYMRDGYVERYRRVSIPNATLPYMRSLTPAQIQGHDLETLCFDEYLETDLSYLKLLTDRSVPTLLALVGVQSHQFQRALDLAAFAREEGGVQCVIGGPHPMTCDTRAAQGIDGISFAVSEAESIWHDILADAITGNLKSVYGGESRWQRALDPPPLISPSKRDLKRSFYRLHGIYPARGCPFKCNFCSVIKIAGRSIRSQPVETTLESLRRAQNAGVRMVMFTSDNFNKYPEASALLEAMIEDGIRLPFLVQCDTQVAKEPEFIELLGRAGCFAIFLGVESFDYKSLRAAGKNHNRLDHYVSIIEQCRRARIITFFSSILGFPDDTLQSIDHHLNTLRRMAPDWATFYILTPVPGTEQYDDFRTRDLINEPNLDRFDATCLTWKHPTLGGHELETAMYRSFRRFHGPRQQLGAAMKWALGSDYRAHAHRLAGVLGPTYFHLMAMARSHPGVGGIIRVRRDHVSDYLERRKRVFGFVLAPMPDSLTLSNSDEQFNRRAKLEIGQAVKQTQSNRATDRGPIARSLSP